MLITGAAELGLALSDRQREQFALLAAETVGRAYGGGMLKIEPREADHLPVPSPELVRGCADDLRRIRPAVAARLRAGQLLDAVALVDEAILSGDLTSGQLDAIRQEHASLAARRRARGRDTAGGG